MGKRSVNKLEMKIAQAEVFDAPSLYGLNQSQVAARKKEGLTNKTKHHVSRSYAKIFRDNVFNLLNLVLVLVIAVMIWAKLSWSYYLFAGVLLANIIIGLIQDIHARKIVDSLSILTRSETKVVREGKEIVLPSSELVLSDVVVFEAGGQIPADALILDGEIKVNEAIVTGESSRIEKKTGDYLYSGSYVVSGRCKAKLVAIGEASYAEKIEQKATRFTHTRSEMSSLVYRVALISAVMAIVFAIVATLAYGFIQNEGASFFDRINPENPSGKEFLEGLTGAMVAIVPAGMFLLSSISLSIGLIALGKHRVLVQDTRAIESLSNVDVICFDKTGTLTDGTMSVDGLMCMNGFHRAEIGYAISTILHFTKDQTSTANALREHFGDHSAETSRTISPFDSQRKNSFVELDVGTVYAMGAYGFLPIKEDKEVEAIIEEKAKQGIRTLVLGFGEKSAKGDGLPKNMKLAALIFLTDHLREEAKDNIAWLQNHGLRVYMISGDDAALVSHLGELCGLEGAAAYTNLTGKSDEEILSSVSSCRVFGRATPDQKALLISELKRQGHKVAMVGDGVNDVLAFKEANASVALSSGARASKNFAHFTILDNDFSHLPQIILEGRRAGRSLARTASLFLMKSMFALVSIVCSIVLSFFVKMPGTDVPFYYPFSTANFLVWEVFAIALPTLLMAFDRAEEKPIGNFKKYVASSAVPGAIIALLLVALPLLALAFFPSWIGSSGLEGALTISVISLTAFAYCFLLKNSSEIGRYRLLVFALSLAAGAGMFVWDYFAGGTLLDLTYVEPQAGYALVFVATLGGGLFLYFVITLIQLLVNRRKEHAHR